MSATKPSANCVIRGSFLKNKISVVLCKFHVSLKQVSVFGIGTSVTHPSSPHAKNDNAHSP
ncbi:hypothetical protein BB560_001559 [Smittium megazygosporum]|uniref:Uncharacterized protein n=1 Tax=Smittium megazygosporum TaxID=133381 RepID=A0A2T9ZH88_9FUNG|nr:hypothetical protein BB560_001559 [Smittium megazygosporum]